METDLSPVIHNGTAKTMSFPDAMNEVISGNRISRLEWGSNDEYCLLQGERLSIHTKGSDHIWIVSESDMRALDWVTIPFIKK